MTGMDGTRKGLLMMHEHSDVFERDLDDLDAMWEQEEMGMDEDDLAVLSFERTYEQNWIDWIHQTFVNLRAWRSNWPSNKIKDNEVPMFIAWALQDAEHGQMYPF